jgi:asparagine synthase (glutamine-hydrolysing)
LPAEVVDRRKSGFGVPLARWFREPDGMGARIAALPDSASADVFDRDLLRRLVAEHRTGQHDHSELLWTALNVATWRDAFRC